MLPGRDEEKEVAELNHREHRGHREQAEVFHFELSEQPLGAKAAQLAGNTVSALKALKKTVLDTSPFSGLCVC